MAVAPDENRERLVEEAVGRYIEAQSSGQKLDVNEFLKQYPGLEHKIREGLKNLERIETLFDSVLQADEGDFAKTSAGSLSVGQKLGDFEITDVIGHGGMGVVYKAHDAKLDRDVAVKTLPAELLGDSTAQERFRREAKMLAALNHPHVAAIHEMLEEPNGLCYLILEYVPGQTLAERIRRGRLKLQEVLSIALSISEGLAAAYTRGIIHRDLKPGNVMITPEGTVKVLDFGIAKNLGSDDRTKDSLVTQPGRIVGTPAYMSPEQTRGKSVDHRSDVWAFGCVLYEMLVGESVFGGETVSDTVAHVLQSEPDWRKLPADVSANIRVLLRRCLEKDATHRLQHIGDAAMEIAETLNAPPVAPPVGSVPVSRAGRSWPLAVTCVVVGLVLGVLVTTALLTIRRPSWSQVRSNLTHRTTITLPEGQTIASSRSMPSHVAQPTLALSPDGSQLVYVGETGTTTQLFLRSMDKFDTKAIPGTQGGFAPFFKPDGEAVGFFTEGKLKRISLQGGESVTICDATNPTGACWASDGMIYFGESHGDSLACVNATISGHSEHIQTGAEGPNLTYRNVMHPELLPDERHLLLSSQTGIILLSLLSYQKTLLIPGGRYGRFVPTEGFSGYIIYARAGAIEAVGFNWRTLETVGRCAPVLDGVMADSLRGVFQFAVSRTGSLAYVAGADIAKCSAVWVDRSGKEVGVLPLKPGFYGQFRLSPDGKRLAIHVIEGNRDDIYVYDLIRDLHVRLTRQGSNSAPVWTADGKRVTFTRQQEQGQTKDLVWLPADGGAEPEVLYTSTHIGGLGAYSWSPDGFHLAFIQTDPKRQPDIWILDMSDSKAAHTIVATKYSDWGPAFSPNGRLLAYTSDREGQYHVYIRSYPNADWEQRIWSDFGEEPIWSPKGNELFYRNGDKWMVVAVSTDPTFSVGVPQVLFEGRYSNVPGTSYDVSPDGQRFVVLKPDQDDSGVREIHFVSNWLEELRRLSPSD